MKNRSPLALLLLMLALPVVGADAGDGRQLYLGVGFGSALVSEAVETQSALQLTIGYPITSPPQFDSPYNSFAIEAGYVDVSDYDHDSYWVTPVYRRYLNSELDLVLRVGMAVGHDTGRTGALGLEYKIDSALAVRLEYVERPKASASLINVIYRP